MDGQQIAQLMLGYDIGVSKIETDEIKRFDNNYLMKNNIYAYHY